jgi:hypothetical protein
VIPHQQLSVWQLYRCISTLPLNRGQIETICVATSTFGKVELQKINEVISLLAADKSFNERGTTLNFKKFRVVPLGGAEGRVVQPIPG